MTVTRAIGWFFGRIINAIVGALALSRVHPNVLTFYRPADQYLGGVPVCRG